MATEQQIPTLMGVVVSNQSCFSPLPTTDAQWAIEHPEEAIALCVAAIMARGTQQPAPLVEPEQLVKRTLVPWKTVRVGGLGKKELVKKVGESCEEVGGYAKDLMTKPAFVTAEKEGTADLVTLSLRDLGFKKNPRTDAFMTKEFCAKWSAEHLEGYAIELCEPEDAPWLRISYQDQPKGELLWMAMERITDSAGRPLVFRIGRGGGGARWLYAGWAPPDGAWLLGCCIVFRLRKLPQPSAA